MVELLIFVRSVSQMLKVDEIPPSAIVGALASGMGEGNVQSDAHRCL